MGGVGLTDLLCASLLCFRIFLPDFASQHLHMLGWGQRPSLKGKSEINLASLCLLALQRSDVG